MAVRVLAGGPVRESRHVFAAHVEAMRRQGGDLELGYVNDGDWDLAEVGVEVLARVPPHGVVQVGDRIGETHLWVHADFNRMARMRDVLLEEGERRGADLVWFVDADVLPGPGVLGRLLEVQRQRGGLVSGVFWTQWQAGAGRAMPQVWEVQPYGISEESMRVLGVGGVVRVWGGGACMLVPVDRRLRYWPRLGGLPRGGMWQGEDRSFCIKAEVHGFPQWAVGGLAIEHLYHVEQREESAVRGALEELYG